MNFDDACCKIKSTVNLAGEKTEKLFDRGKVKLDLSIAKNELNKLYADLGRAVYGNGNPNAEIPGISERCAKISAKLDEIARLKEKIENLR